MDNNERYYQFRYFEANRNELGQILLENAGVNPTQAKINLSKEQLSITIQTTKTNYSKVAQKVKELLSKDVRFEVIDVVENEEHYVPCMYDRRLNKDFRKKFEEKYNVLLMETAKVYYNQGDFGFRGGRGGRGGYYNQGGRESLGGTQQCGKREPGTFSIQNKRIEVSHDIKSLNYSYVVVGNHLDIKNARMGINKSIAKYIKVEDVFPIVP
jgi:hypothetical protein